MDKRPKFQRPSFGEALGAWQTLLNERRLPAECLWIFDENLCFEKAAGSPGGFRLGFQTRFTPPPTEGELLAFEYFADFDHRLVFYRIGSWREKSVCLVLCDDWFEARGPNEGFIRRDEWLMSFRPGPAETVEEVTDEARWKNRILRDRPLHDLDFCMTLRAVHEILAHGRVLTNYEHAALKFLHLWHRVLGHKD